MKVKGIFKRLLWKPKVYVVGKQCESIVWLSKNSDIVEGGTRRLLRIQAQVSVPPWALSRRVT